jgi:hypothetical protein
MSHQMLYRTRLPFNSSRGEGGSYDLDAAVRDLRISRGKTFSGLYLEIPLRSRLLALAFPRETCPKKRLWCGIVRSTPTPYRIGDQTPRGVCNKEYPLLNGDFWVGDETYYF